MQLSELIASIENTGYNIKETEITSIEFDSRKTKPGTLFIAVKGAHYDGHDFLDNAMKNGAVAMVTERKIPTQVPQIVVKNSRKAMGKLAKKFYGDFDDICKIGITGTNGKTTTAFLIHSILETADKNPGLIGTIYYVGKTTTKAERTTPESLDIFKLFNQFRNEGAHAIVMEVSSHALSLERVNEITFQAVVFTNLSQDHLDFHGTMEDYRASKMRIFPLLENDGFAIFNVDDPIRESIDLLHLRNTVTFGLKNRGDVWAEIIKENIDGMQVRVFYRDQNYRVDSKLIGYFNIYNILAAFATAVALDIDINTVIAGIENLQSIRGRVERVVDNVFVDFAHTPSALENVLKSLKQYTRGKLIIVFGCGGDRDKGKRPIMGALASRLADLTVITSDNPRSESPKSIIEDIKKGMSTPHYEIIEDRREAIRYALSLKKKNDTLLVAGKGHEEHQSIGSRTIDFDDAEVIRECLESL